MAHRWMLIAAMLVVAAACTSAQPGDEVVTYGGADTPAAVDAPGDAEAAAPASPYAEPVTPNQPSPQQPTAEAPPNSPSTTEVDRTAAFAGEAKRGAGNLARVYLQPRPAQRIVVEVLEQPGASARAGTVDHLTTVLRDASQKRVLDGGRWSIPDDRRVWSAEAINEIVDSRSRVEHERDVVVLHILFLRGSFDQSASVLGVATRADTFAVFVDRVASASTALVGRAEIEAAVGAHELGHLLGLVDLVVDTGRDDPEHPGHSRNKGSVMYWAVESGLVTQVLAGGPPRDFDDDDRRDLALIRSGA